jgi:hypothetical protein
VIAVVVVSAAVAGSRSPEAETDQIDHFYNRKLLFYAYVLRIAIAESLV